MKKFFKWFRNLFKKKVLVEDIEKILNFEWDKREMQTAPHSLRSQQYWAREWYHKCERIHDLINYK